MEQTIRHKTKYKKTLKDRYKYFVTCLYYLLLLDKKNTFYWLKRSLFGGVLKADIIPDEIVVDELQYINSDKNEINYTVRKEKLPLKK